MVVAILGTASRRLARRAVQSARGRRRQASRISHPTGVPGEMSMLKELALADFELEVATTRRVLERLPDEKLSWKPHAKSKTLGELGAHIVDVLGLQIQVMETDEV